MLTYGADPTGTANSSDAIQRTLDAATGTEKSVWIPAGNYTVTKHLIADQVTVTGVGVGVGVGIFGTAVADGGLGTGVKLADFAILGEVTERDNNAALSAIGGTRILDQTTDGVNRASRRR